jgi:hypothetical protein
MTLTEAQVQHGYWYHLPEDDFPPPAVTDPADYDGGPRLNLVCTQLDITSHRQRKLVEEWCALLRERLPALQHGTPLDEEMIAEYGLKKGG